MFRHIAAITAAAMLMAGCAQNYVQTFEPVIDRKGVSEAAYARDLSECRSYAVREDPANKAMEQALAGALVGAALGAAVGSVYGNAGYGAGVGAGYGAVGGGVNGAVTGMRAQQLIVSRCMARRGYAVLYGGDLAP